MSARLVVLISGNGTNLHAILDAITRGELDARVEWVISNRKAAYGLVRAAEVGVPTLYFPLKPYTDAGKSREQYDRDLAERVSACAPDFVVLAGWMHVLSPAFLNRFPRRVINLHPALPGQFPGIDAIPRTFEAYQRGEVAGGGCMVHYVIPEVDAGEVIGHVEVPIAPGDTLDSFEARLHEAEHRLLVRSLRSLVSPRRREGM